MADVRVLALSGVTSTAPDVRILALSGSGTTSAAPSVRLLALSGSGTTSASLLPLVPLTVEPLSTVTLEAVLSTGATADSYAWRRVSGAAVTLTAAGSSCSFTAPAAMPPGATVVIGVRATISGVQGAEQQVTITSLPQLLWTQVPGGPWTPARMVVS